MKPKVPAKTKKAKLHHPPKEKKCPFAHAEAAPAVLPVPAESANDRQERLRAILTTAVEGIITIDVRGSIESANPAAERLFGYTEAELIGRNVKVLMPSPFQERHDDYLKSYLRTGDAKIIGIGREVVGLRKDGSTFPMDLSVSEVKLSSGRYFTGIVRDITVRKQAEVELRLQYETARALAQSSTVGEAAARLLEALCRALGWVAGQFWCVDAEPDLLRCVETWKETGLSLPNMESAIKQVAFQRGAGIPGQVWETKKLVWISDVSHSISTVILQAARADELHGALALPITAENEVLGVLMFFSRLKCPARRMLDQALTSLGAQIGQFMVRRRAEEKLARLAATLAEKNKELETIVYVVSHDLRSPLINVQGFSKELGRVCAEMQSIIARSADGAVPAASLKEPFEQTIPRALKFIGAGVARMDALLSGFLRFSRAGRAVLQFATVNADELVASALQSLQFQLSQSGATVHVSALPKCRGDSTYIGQVFFNLVDNAIKYRDPERPLTIDVSGAIDGDQAVYRVTDNGIGIAEPHQPKIFEIFHRLDPASTAGEGLGLALAQRTLERQHGRIWVESKPGVGSTFFVSLPCVT